MSLEINNILVMLRRNYHPERNTRNLTRRKTGNFETKIVFQNKDG